MLNFDTVIGEWELERIRKEVGIVKTKEKEFARSVRRNKRKPKTMSGVLSEMRTGHLTRDSLQRHCYTKEKSTVYVNDSMVTLARMPTMRGRSSILYSCKIW